MYKLGRQKYKIKVFYDDHVSINGYGSGAYYRIEDLETGEITWRWNTLNPDKKEIGIIVSFEELEKKYNHSLRKEKLERIANV